MAYKYSTIIMPNGKRITRAVNKQNGLNFITTNNTVVIVAFDHVHEVIKDSGVYSNVYKYVKEADLT